METHSHPTSGNGKYCYIELPSRDIKKSSSFYSNIFGWDIRNRSDGSVAFDDEVNEVSGIWRKDRKPAAKLVAALTKPYYKPAGRHI